jgi:hypothetical protein
MPGRIGLLSLPTSDLVLLLLPGQQHREHESGTEVGTEK